MAWEGNVSPAEEPAPSDKDAKDSAAAESDEDAVSSASADAAEPQCSGSEDDKADEDTQEAADTTESTDQNTPQNAIPRFRLPLLGRVPARCLPFWVGEFAAALTKGLTPIQMNVLGSFVATIGDAISLIASKAEVEEDEGII